MPNVLLDLTAAAYARLQNVVCNLRMCVARDANNPVNDAAPNIKFPFNRPGIERLLKRRFFIAPSFEIYNGVSGLYDYGPPGCSTKNNLIALWRQHFVVEEAMLELEASCLTPEVVLKASGHVDKFTDLLVKDVETDDCYRADHVLKDRINDILDNTDKNLTDEEKEQLIALRERLDELNESEMDAMIMKHQVRAPQTGNSLTVATPFNLMFKTSIGPSGLLPGYLRPETAQGIFVNYKRLSEYMGGRLPFACAQIGLSFRNEISPKSGLLRLREFQQAEIEHFVNPDDKSHPKFKDVKDVKLNLYGRAQQVKAPFHAIEITMREALSKGMVANETLGYFIARTFLFTQKIGMNPAHVRFRQHLEHEMAHYAQDCWDLEVNCSYGWVECAGLADRAAFDLSNHSAKSGVELSSREVFTEIKYMDVLVCVPNKGVLGKTFRRDAQVIMKAIAEMSEEEIKNLKTSLELDGNVTVKGFNLSTNHISFKIEKQAVTGRNFYPSVIEPSFGIDRLLYCLWEHSYFVRDASDDVQRAVLALKPTIAPVKCVVLPLSKNEIFSDKLNEIGTRLGRAGLIYRVDDSGVSIGKRYSRADEIGTPFGITVDLQTVKDGTVTVRERDSMNQIRCSTMDAVEIVTEMVSGVQTWEDAQLKYGTGWMNWCKSVFRRLRVKINRLLTRREQATDSHDNS